MLRAFATYATYNLCFDTGVLHTKMLYFLQKNRKLQQLGSGFTVQFEATAVPTTSSVLSVVISDLATSISSSGSSLL